MINEEYDLESYLEKMVNDDVVMLQLRDRSELINKINAKQDGKQCPQQQIDNECHTEQGHPEWKK